MTEELATKLNQYYGVTTGSQLDPVSLERLSRYKALQDDSTTVEILGMIINHGMEYTLNFLDRYGQDPNMIWMIPEMSIGRRTEIEEISTATQRELAIQMTGKKCKSCGSDRLLVDFKQTRSGDEPMTIFYKCTVCKTAWKE